MGESGEKLRSANAYILWLMTVSLLIVGCRLPFGYVSEQNVQEINSRPTPVPVEQILSATRTWMDENDKQTDFVAIPELGVTSETEKQIRENMFLMSDSVSAETGWVIHNENENSEYMFIGTSFHLASKPREIPKKIWLFQPGLRDNGVEVAIEVGQDKEADVDVIAVLKEDIENWLGYVPKGLELATQEEFEKANARFVGGFPTDFIDKKVPVDSGTMVRVLPSEKMPFERDPENANRVYISGAGNVGNSGGPAGLIVDGRPKVFGNVVEKSNTAVRPEHKLSGQLGNFMRLSSAYRVSMNIKYLEKRLRDQEATWK